MNKYYDSGFWIVYHIETGHDVHVCETVEDADDFIDDAVF